MLSNIVPKSNDIYIWVNNIYIYPIRRSLNCKGDVFLREDGVILIGKINKARLDIVDI